MEIGETFYAMSRKAWRAWLAKNHATKREIWLVYPNKASGKRRIAYNDAVEEALCFGWIDSTRKKYCDAACAQRFTPRRKGSAVSWMNKERIWQMIGEGKMTPYGLEAVAKVFDYNEKAEDFVFPPDIMAAIKKDGRAWKNFQKMPERYKRVRVAYIKRQGEHSREAYDRSLKNFIKKTAQNKRFGMMTG